MTKKIFFLTTALSSLFIACNAYAGGSTMTYGLGVEGFQDKYKVDSFNTENEANYGSIIGYVQRSTGGGFGTVDLRISHGSSKFDSKNDSELQENPVGTVSGIPEWEFELRGRFGITRPMWGGSFSPYLGVGARYQREEGKGYLTNIGYETFDTRTMQLYVPIGASLAFDVGDGWSFTPSAELDISLWGSVDKRLTALNNGARIFFDPSDTHQKLGFGGRSEMMFGKTFDTYTWQVGPFVRYWHFNASDSSDYINQTTGKTEYVREPSNDRTQIGFTARVLW